MKTTRVELVDDIDGSTGVESLEIIINKKGWEIDLNAEHAAEFWAAINPWLEKARKMPGTKVALLNRTKPAPTRTRRPDDAVRIRMWARDNGYEVSERGRIPKSILDAYYGNRDTTVARGASADDTAAE